MSEFENRVLTCVYCCTEFVFSAEEQLYFHSKGLTNEPKRCANCRVVARSKRAGRGTANIFEGMCADCQEFTKLPFRPRNDRPIYCKRCMKMREGPSGQLRLSSEDAAAR